MKYSKYIFIALLAVSILAACKDDEVGPVIHLNGAPQITAPTAGTAYVLTEAESDSLLSAISWSAADWGLNVPTRYILEIDQVGNNFEDAVALYTGSATEVSDLTVEDLNNVMVGKDLPFEVASAMEIRVVATTGTDSNPESSTLGTDASPQISNVVAISVTPYEANKVIPELQVPGSYQGWNPGDTTTVLFSVENDGLFEGYVYISPDGSFYKFTQGLSWDVNWGDNGNDGTLEPNGADIPAAVTGVYKLNVNLNALTHTQTLTNWGLIGNATPTGWDSDTDMTYDAGTKALTITIDLVPGAIKFRANDDWAINLGDTDANGSLEYGGTDIVIAEAGNYTINLYIVGVSKYTYSITKN